MEKTIFQYFQIGAIKHDAITGQPKDTQNAVIYLPEPVWIIPFNTFEVKDESELTKVQTLIFFTQHRN